MGQEMTEQELTTSANAEVPEDLIEIHDPEIDPEQIVERIRARVQERRAEAGYDRRTFPSFGVTAYPGEPEDIPYDPNLYHHLRLVNETYTRIETAVALAPSPATRIPVLGRLWQLIREQAHGLVLFYVNRAVADQVTVNRHLISVLNQLTALTQEQQRQIRDLRSQLQQHEPE